MSKYIFYILIGIFIFIECKPTADDQKVKQMDEKTISTKDKTPIIETQMLIRRPVDSVFEAFINPDITSNFWFTKSTGRMEEGKKLDWSWEMYNVTIAVDILEILPNKLIAFEWGEPATKVDIQFTELDESATYVVIKNYDFKLSGDELSAAIKDGTGGFTTVLDGLKAYLEHGIELNLIRDKYPKELTQHGN